MLPGPDVLLDYLELLEMPQLVNMMFLQTCINYVCKLIVSLSDVTSCRWIGSRRCGRLIGSGIKLCCGWPLTHLTQRNRA
jgi:hypothetical protein